MELRNGSEEHEGLVKVTMASLASLMEERPLHLYELVMVARNPSHKPFGRTEEDLVSLSLLDAGGRMHDSIRNIIVSAVEGDGLEMSLRSPEAP